jgi:glycosyltransferase involved in cell wall biosynthesis
MACGLPAIGGDGDGSVEPLSCSRLGFAVPPEQVAEAIAALLEAPLRPAAAGALAERFGIARFAAQLAGLTSSAALAGR